MIFAEYDTCKECENMADGTIIIETGLDNSGIEKGIKQTKKSL